VAIDTPSRQSAAAAAAAGARPTRFSGADGNALRPYASTTLRSHRAIPFQPLRAPTASHYFRCSHPPPPPMPLPRFRDAPSVREARNAATSARNSITKPDSSSSPSLPFWRCLLFWERMTECYRT